MSELSRKTCLVYDHGLHFPIAQRLARDFGRVLYFTPFEKGMSEINDGILGWGFDNIERIYDIWKYKPELDLAVFPDVEDAGLQTELSNQGIPAWGSRYGDSLELSREKFHKVLERVGLDVPKFHKCEGIAELRAFLKDNKGPFYLKVSRWRGSFETIKFRSWELDECLLDSIAFKLGPAKEIVPFLVFDEIVTDLEVGADTWNINGRWPSLCLRGDESKDKAYLSSVMPTKDLPAQIHDVIDAFGPELEKYSYRNFWSMEIRITDSEAFFGDATCRGPMPATPSHTEIWKNFSEVIYAGAHGEILEPEPISKNSCELILTSKTVKGCWSKVEIPTELKQWIKPSNCCQINGNICFPPNEHQGNDVGWLVAIDDTVEGVVSKIKEYVDKLPDGLSADLEPLGELLDVVAEAQEQNIDFPADVPPPEIVMENGT